MNTDSSRATSVHDLLAAIGDALATDPSLEDYYGWDGRSPGPWIHATASTATRAWASSSEIPFVTLCPTRSEPCIPVEPTRRKVYADRGLVHAPGGVLVRTTVTPYVDGRMRDVGEDIPWDLAALLATDWPRTRTPHANGTDPAWWRWVPTVSDPWVLHISAVYGEAPLRLDTRRLLERGIESGLHDLHDRLGPSRLRHLPRRVACALRRTPDLALRRKVAHQELFVLGWAEPIRAGDPMPRTA